MRTMSRVFLGVLLAVGLPSVAFAETPGSNPSSAPGDFTLSAQLDLDQQFELSFAHAADGRLQRMSGPSSMSCSHALTTSILDTCVVTAQGTPRSAGPAALAAH